MSSDHFDSELSSFRAPSQPQPYWNGPSFSATKLFSTGWSCVIEWWLNGDGQPTHLFCDFIESREGERGEKDPISGRGWHTWTIAREVRDLTIWAQSADFSKTLKSWRYFLRMKHICLKRKLSVRSFSSHRIRQRANTRTILFCSVYECIVYISCMPLSLWIGRLKKYNYSTVSDTNGALCECVGVSLGIHIIFLKAKVAVVTVMMGKAKKV